MAGSFNDRFLLTILLKAPTVKHSFSIPILYFYMKLTGISKLKKISVSYF